MTSTQKLIVGAIVAYLIWRSGILDKVLGGVFGGVGVSSPGAAPSSTPSTPSNVPGKPAYPAQTSDAKVSAGWDDSTSDDALTQDVNFDTRGPILYEQLIRPAGRVRPWADVPALYLSYAMSVLQMDTTDLGVGARQDDRSQRHQQVLASIAQKQAGELTDKIFGTIVQVIVSAFAGALAGGAIGAVVNQQEADLAASVAGDLRGDALLSALKQSADPKTLPPWVRALLTPNVEFDADSMRRLQSTGIDPESMFSSRYVSGGATHALSDFPWHAADGTPYWFPSKWFVLTPDGFLLPWLGARLFGATMADTVEIRARVFRALDTFRCMAYPSDPGTVANGYWYVNKYLGPILGSCLPPTSEDTNYVDKNGQWYTFDGRAALSPAQALAQAGKTALGPVNVPGYAPDPGSAAASAGGDGGEFAPRVVDPQQLNVAVNPTPVVNPVTTVGHIAFHL